MSKLGNFLIILFSLSTIVLGIAVYVLVDQNEKNSADLAAVEHELSKYKHVSGAKDTYTTPIRPETVHKLVNIERSSADLNTLRYSKQLEKTACIKADDMVKRDYWSHNDPDGYEPWGIMSRNNIYYVRAGENLAFGAYSSSETVKAWMESPGHKRNVMGKGYTDEGICVRKSADYQGGRNVVIVQHFAQF